MVPGGMDLCKRMERHMAIITMELLMGIFFLTSKENHTTMIFEQVSINPKRVFVLALLKEEFDLQLAYQMSILQAEHALELKQIKISLDIQEKKCNNIISIKDKEIAGLNKIIAKKPGKNAIMWGVIGGFVAGAAATVGIVYAVNK